MLWESILDLRKCRNKKMHEKSRFSSLGTSRGPKSNPREVFYLSLIYLQLKKKMFCHKKWLFKNGFPIVFSKSNLTLEGFYFQEEEKIWKSQTQKKCCPSFGDNMPEAQIWKAPFKDTPPLSPYVWVIFLLLDHTNPHFINWNILTMYYVHCYRTFDKNNNFFSFKNILKKVLNILFL